MTEKELQEFLLQEYPHENASCEWKEMKNLKNSFANDPHKDVISYVSAIANMNGGHLIIGVVDKTLEIVGTDLTSVSFNNAPATLNGKLSETMSEQQKINKITNLIASLRKSGKIQIGEKRLWFLVQEK